MAASEKTAVLGLSLWAGTDKPRRLDFVEDNEALEMLVGAHLQNEDLHLNDERLARVDQPFETRTYTGTGAESRGLAFSFPPKAVIGFAAYRSNTGYAGFAANGRSSAGLAVNGIQVTVKQDASAALNENGVTYVMLAFR